MSNNESLSQATHDNALPENQVHPKYQAGAKLAGSFLSGFLRDPDSVTLGGYIDDAVSCEKAEDRWHAAYGFGEMLEVKLRELVCNRTATEKIVLAEERIAQARGILAALLDNGATEGRFETEHEQVMSCIWAVDTLLDQALP